VLEGQVGTSLVTEPVNHPDIRTFSQRGIKDAEVQAQHQQEYRNAILLPLAHQARPPKVD